MEQARASGLSAADILLSVVSWYKQMEDTMHENYKAKSGTMEPVWRIEIQTRPDDANRLLDAIMEVYSLKYGRYQRNATVSSVGDETAQPEENSTTTNHIEGFKAGSTETYPMVQLFIAVERDVQVLQKGDGCCHLGTSLRGTGDLCA